MGHPGLRPSSSDKELSKANKVKFEKKLKFYSKVKETVAALGAKKAISKKNKLRSRQKKLKAYDLSALSECLPDSKPSQKLPQETNLKQNCKSRWRILEMESAKLKAVLSHLVFQSDPLAAIHQHLQSTQPPTIGENRVKNTRKGEKKNRNKKLSASSGPQSMKKEA